MSLGLVRGLFFVAALSVSALAAASWYEPGPGVISSNGRSYCLSPALKPLTPPSVQANPVSYTHLTLPTKRIV